MLCSYLKSATSVLFLTLFFFLPAALAGGFDNSGLPFGIIFDTAGKPNELWVSYSRVSPKISGTVYQTRIQSNPTLQTENVVKSYGDFEIGVRLKITDRVSCALRTENPYFASVGYQDDTLSYVSDSSSNAAPVTSQYRSKLLTVGCRYRWVVDDQFVYVYGGPKYQKVSGFFSSDLSPESAGRRDNLEVSLDGGSEYGYFLGLAYEVPSIAARVELVYHNEINYSLRGHSLTPISLDGDRLWSEASSRTATPKSVQLKLRSGVSENVLIFANFRWGDWSSVSGIKVQDGVGNPSISLYDHDTVNLNTGVMLAINDKWNMGGSYSTVFSLSGGSRIGASLRNPQGTRHTIFFGVQYWPKQDIALDTGASFTEMENKKIDENAFVGEFEDMSAISVSAGVSWFF